MAYKRMESWMTDALSRRPSTDKDLITLGSGQPIYKAHSGYSRGFKDRDEALKFMDEDNRMLRQNQIKALKSIIEELGMTQEELFPALERGLKKGFEK